MSYWPVLNNISLHSFHQYSPTHSDVFQDYYGSESSDYSNDPLAYIHHCNLEVCDEVFRGQVGSISCRFSLSTESIVYSFQACFSCRHFEPCPILVCFPFRTMSPCAIISNHVLKLASNHVSFEPCPITPLDIWKQICVTINDRCHETSIKSNHYILPFVIETRAE